MITIVFDKDLARKKYEKEYLGASHIIKKSPLSIYYGKSSLYSRIYQRNRRQNDSNFRLQRAIARRERDALKRGLGGHLNVIDVEEIKINQQFKCKLCGIHESIRKLTIDHIIPITKWIEWALDNNPSYHACDKENIQLLCINCNSSKGNRLSCN